LDLLPVLLQGALITIEITIISFFFALIIGIITALARISNNKIFSTLARIYISIIRGTPILVQLMYIYFVLPELGVSISAFTSAIIGLALNEGAYLAETFRAGINSVDKGQKEAAFSIGMNYKAAMKRIILPQAFRNILPPVGNSAILLLKNSSLTSVIAVNELMHTGEQLATSTFRTIEIFTIVAILYWVIHVPMTLLVNKLERRMDVDSTSRH